MKKFIVLLVSIVMSCSALAASYRQSMQAIVEGKGTIRDYALACDVCGDDFGGAGEQGYAFRDNALSTIGSKGSVKISVAETSVYLSDVVLDMKNGYFEMTVKDYVDDNFPRTITMALFIAKDGSKTAGITQDYMGMDSDTYTYRFFRIIAGKWSDVTKDILSSISLDDISSDRKVMKDVGRLIQWRMELPRVGTTAILHAGSYYDMNEQEAKLFMNQIGDGSTMQLEWDRERGKFRRGEIRRQLTPRH